MGFLYCFKNILAIEKERIYNKSIAFNHHPRLPRCHGHKHHLFHLRSPYYETSIHPYRWLARYFCSQR